MKKVKFVINENDDKLVRDYSKLVLSDFDKAIRQYNGIHGTDIPITDEIGFATYQSYKGFAKQLLYFFPDFPDRVPFREFLDNDNRNTFEHFNHYCRENNINDPKLTFDFDMRCDDSFERFLEGGIDSAHYDVYKTFHDNSANKAIREVWSKHVKNDLESSISERSFPI